MAKPETSKESDVKKLPLFIQYLSEPDTPYDCWFQVLHPDKPSDPPEKIGGSKLNLMAHSVVFRKMLHESPLAEKGPITIPDISPSTFRHLLKFTNGHFDVTSLTLEEAVALLCASEKYSVDDLRRRLGLHISSLLSVDNIFLPMMTQECFCEETIKKAIDKIIQQQTKELVAKDDFLKLNIVGILNIVTQDSLQIPEIELWRAVIRWAKHQGSEKLREVLTEPLKHIRFCTLDGNDFIKDVVSTGILTDGEIATVVKILGGATGDISRLGSLDYNLFARNLFSGEELQIDFSSFHVSSKYCDSISFNIITKTKTVQLVSATIVKIAALPLGDTEIAPKKIKFEFDCACYLKIITESFKFTEKNLVLKVSKESSMDSEIIIDFPEGTKLLPESKYKLLLKFGHKHSYLVSELPNQSLIHEHLEISSMKGQYLFSHIKNLKFKVL